MSRVSALLLCAAGAASAQPYAGPFTQLTASFLDVADPADGFGPEDKLNACNGDLVFIDLDEVGGEWFKYTTATGAWSKGPIGASGPQCPQPLYPRTGGYSVGLTKSDALTDRLLVIGGANGEKNVYYSDDCGLTFSCYSANQVWDPKSYTNIVHAEDVFPGDPVFLIGGLSNGVTSLAHFQSNNGGRDWTRPTCADSTNCRGSLQAKASPPDTKGFCSDPVDYAKCYILPDIPAYSGTIAADWNTVWFWLNAVDDGTVWFLNATTYSSGWMQAADAVFGGFGRKVFIRGGAPLTGCECTATCATLPPARSALTLKPFHLLAGWFSTDYDAEGACLARALALRNTRAHTTLTLALPDLPRSLGLSQIRGRAGALFTRTSCPPRHP